MISPTPQEIVDMDAQEQEELLRRAEQAGVSTKDLGRFRAVFESYDYVSSLIATKEMNIRRLRNVLFGSRTERWRDLKRQQERRRAAREDRTSTSETSAVGTTAPTVEVTAAEPQTEPAAVTPSSSSASAASTDGKSTELNVPEPKAAGHGRRGADDISGAERTSVKHPTLQAGGPCPECPTGVLYEQSVPAKLIRFRGRPPVSVQVYELQRLRCGLCGKVFRAAPPAEAGESKYEPTVATAIGILKYGAGFPFYRIEKIQAYAELPLATATQWSILTEAYASYLPVFETLIHVAAQGEVLHNDDTTARILEHMGLRAERANAASRESNSSEAGEPLTANETTNKTGTGDDRFKGRTGLFTTSIVAIHEHHRVALFFSGKRHAGENLNEVLRQRATEHPPPIQICDALSRNYPREFATIVGNCLTHARRNFVEINETFESEVNYVLAKFAAIYHHDELAREQRLTPVERLVFHQERSQSVLTELHAWLKRQFAERLVEPNSGLGAAINYLLKHWEKLTLFVRKAGVPLDNNIAERALKKAVLHRKNSYFYLTDGGAKMGDLHMSLIHTCELNGINPFDYLTELQQNSEEVARAPDRWLPWTYRSTLESRNDAAPSAADNTPSS